MPATDSTLTQKRPAPIKEKDIVAWTGPERPFKRRGREFYVNLFAIAGIVGLILFLVEGWMPVILIISLIFLFYVMSTVEPGNTEYKITNLGVRVANRRTNWDQIARFWFTRRYSSDLVVFETANFPGRLEFVFEGSNKEKIRKAIERYVPEETAPPSFLDKASNWFAKKLD